MGIKLSVITILVILFLVGTVFFILNNNEEQTDSTLEKIRDRGFIMSLREKDSYEEKIINNKTISKKYLSTNKKLHIKDNKNKTLIDIKLTSPYIVSGLIASDDTKVAEFLLIDWKQNKINLFDEIDFFNIKNDYQEINREFRFKYGVDTEYCSEVGCQIHTHWVEFDSLKELPHKNIKIGAFTNTYANEHVEWIPLIEGFPILEWAAWSVSTATYLQLYNVSGKEASPMGTFINATGNKMYTIGHAGDTVDEYTLTIPWDISTATYIAEVSVSAQDGVMRAVFFNATGNKMYTTGALNEKVFEYNLTTPWDITTAVYFQELAVHCDPEGLFFKPDGTKMYIIQSSEDVIEEYDLLSAWDISSASRLQNYSFVSEGNNPSGLFFNATGNQMYYTDQTSQNVFGYNLSTPWDVTSAIYWNNLDASSQDAGIVGVFFSPDGSDMYLTGKVGRSIYQYNLTALADPYPQIVLNSPVNAFNTTDPTIDFNCTVGDDSGITNVSLLINGTVEQTNSSGLNATDYLFTETIITGGFYNWTCQAYDNVDQANSSAVRTFTYTNALAVAIHYPINAYNSTSPTINFNGTASDETAIINVSLYIDGILNETNSSGLNATEYNFTKTFADGDYNWTFEACDAVSCTSATTRIFSITTTPDIQFISPTYANNTNLTSSYVLVNVSLTETYFSNVTFNFYNDSLTSYFFSNSTRYINVSLAYDTYDYNVTVWTTTRQSNTTVTREITTAHYYENPYTFNSTSFETKTEIFTVNITAGSTPTAGKLIYNGTTYTATITNTVGNEYDISKTIDIPIVTGNKSFHFNFTLDGIEYNTTSQNQTISLTNFSKCFGSLTTEYLNFSFKNEETDTYINATIDTSTWYYWLGTGIVNKTYTYSSTTDYYNYSFCSSATNDSIKLDMSVQYSKTSYPQRKYENASTYVNSSVMNTILYLLSSDDGLSVTFQVLGTASQPISGVAVTGTRTISGSSVVVASGTTGADGGITFWLNPDYAHTFTFSKTGYDTETLSITPTQALYTVRLGGEEIETTTEDYSRGISYSITPTDLNLNYNTTYWFNFTINSVYWDLDEFGITITNGAITYGTDSDTTGTGGTVSVSLDTKANTTIKMKWYYEIDGNFTRGTKTWWVANFTDYGYGISTFFTDLRSYTGTVGTTGIFGLNDFSRTLLIFIFIFIVVGSLTYVVGIYSPAAIIWLVFVLVALFDVGADMLPSPGVAHFPTILILLVAVGFTLREGMK